MYYYCPQDGHDYPADSYSGAEDGLRGLLSDSGLVLDSGLFLGCGPLWGNGLVLDGGLVLSSGLLAGNGHPSDNGPWMDRSLCRRAVGAGTPERSIHHWDTAGSGLSG